jgi:hypothetical protein
MLLYDYGMTAKRRLQRERLAQGASVGRRLMDWLNAPSAALARNRATEDHRRITRLLDNLILLGGMGQFDLGGWEGALDSAAREHAISKNELDRYRQAIKDIRKTLSLYQFHLVVESLDPGRKGDVKFAWYTGRRDGPRVMLALMWLAERELLWRVRRCDKCRRWFYARRKDSRFDTLACRLAWHQSTPETRRKRAAAARERRARERERAERFASQLGRTFKRKGKK